MDVFRNQRGEKARRKLKLRVDAWCWLSETLQQWCVLQKKDWNAFFFSKRNSVLFFLSKFRYLILKRWKNLDFFFLSGWCNIILHFLHILLYSELLVLMAARTFWGPVIKKIWCCFFFFKYHSQSLPTSSEQDQRNTMFSMCWTRAAAFEQTAHWKIQQPQNRQQDAPGWGNPSGRWILVHGIHRDTEKAVRWLWLVALKVMNELFTRRQVRTLGV